MADITYVTKAQSESQQEYIDLQKSRVLPCLEARRGESAVASGSQKRGTAAFDLE